MLNPNKTASKDNDSIEPSHKGPEIKESDPLDANENSLYYFNSDEHVYKVFDPDQKVWLS